MNDLVLRSKDRTRVKSDRLSLIATWLHLLGYERTPFTLGNTWFQGLLNTTLAGFKLEFNWIRNCLTTSTADPTFPGPTIEFQERRGHQGRPFPEINHGMNLWFSALLYLFVIWVITFFHAHTRKIRWNLRKGKSAQKPNSGLFFVPPFSLQFLCFPQFLNIFLLILLFSHWFFGLFGAILEGLGYSCPFLEWMFA